ncbi:hypothetical protein [Psychrobacter sp. I-STPA10]|uniref:hypothetical protein n=1 Tax=Psychrobacter sp. I-STPA10 TaxID=2585769 RepID=UPI001E4F4C86|nr:hypothetical protein [Psychrobacter sp. I-STPA10]
MSKSAFTDIKAKIDHLSLTMRLLVVFVLGVCASLLIKYQVLYWVFDYCLPLFLAVLLTANLKKEKEKTLAGLSWIVGGTLPTIFPSVDLENIFSFFWFNLLAWLCFQCLTQCAISRNKKDFNYWRHIIGWLLIFYCAVYVRNVMVFALVVMSLIRAYQIYFADNLSKINNKGFIFSILFPCALAFSLFGYAYYKNTEQRELADEIVQQILSYQKQHGEYPPTDSFNDYKDSGKIYYNIDSDNMPFLSYREFIPANPYCRYYYDFENRNWDRYCMD